MSNSSMDKSLWWIFFSDSVVMKAIEQNHVINKNIIFECVCHGLELFVIDVFDKCGELLVRFESDVFIVGLKAMNSTNYHKFVIKVRKSTKTYSFMFSIGISTPSSFRSTLISLLGPGIASWFTDKSSSSTLFLNPIPTQIEVI